MFSTPCADGGAVAAKRCGREIAADEASWICLAGEHAALQREHHAAAEDGIEKSKRIAHEQQARRAQWREWWRIFAGDVILARSMLADAEVVLDPEVLLDLAVEDLLRILHAAAGEVFALGHDADADHVVVLRDVPEPALVRHVGHGRLRLRRCPARASSPCSRSRPRSC